MGCANAVADSEASIARCEPAGLSAVPNTVTSDPFVNSASTRAWALYVVLKIAVDVAKEIASVTGTDAAEYVLMKAKGDPTMLAQQVRGALKADASLKVTNIGQAAHLIGSSLTAVDLGGLTTLELAFAVVMAAAAAGLMLALGFIERRRNFAILNAVGAKPGQLAAFLWGEAIVVIVGGFVFGLLSGVVIAWMLVKLLTGVFDPPPEALSIPWLYLGVVLCLVAVSVGAAVLFARPSAGHDAEYLRDF